MKENEYRTHNCNEISLDDVGKKVRIAGFVQTIRDLGGLVFLDIRDMYGITQVVTSAEAADVDFASHIPIESSVTVLGTVRKRDEETVNPKIKTGLVEIKIEEIKVLGKRTKDLPFEVNSNQDIREDLRLQYRFLDLRNDRLKNNLILRAKVLQYLRSQMIEQGFLEVQTPILANSSPEGARDYLVPSRLHPGKFYALPQAPQQFKQLLMASGFDKYYVDHTLAIWPQAAGGIPFNACEFQCKGDTITDLHEDMAAEQKARSTYDNILRMIKDPEICDPIRFLREREIVHYQRFGESLRRIQDDLDSRNFYAFNAQIDKKHC